MKESSNFRPGEPLRSWLAQTEFRHVDAIFAIQMSRSADALARIIAQEELSDADQIALARLNSYAIARWYEPVVTFLPNAQIDPALADLFRAALADAAR